MQEMRTACKDRLLSWERCEAAAHQALLVASAHDASAVGEEEDAAEEEAKARTARSELGQLCSRCRTHSAALRLQCAEATLACAGAALAADDCIEEIRRASTLSILRSASFCMTRASGAAGRRLSRLVVGTFSSLQPKKPRAVASAWRRKAARKRADRTEGAGEGTGGAAIDGDDAWLALLGRCLGAQLARPDLLGMLVASSRSNCASETTSQSSMLSGSGAEEADPAEVLRTEAARLCRRPRAALGDAAANQEAARAGAPGLVGHAVAELSTELRWLEEQRGSALGVEVAEAEAALRYGLLAGGS